MTECIRRRHSYWSHCPCDTCVTDRLRKTQHYNGGLPHRIPNDVAWEVLAAKIDALYTARALGSATGLDEPGAPQGRLYFSRHVAQYRKGRRVYLGPEVAAAIMNMGVPTEGQISAEPSRRRLRALATIGWGLDELATESGIGFSTLATIRGYNERIGAALAIRITALFDHLHMTPGPNEQARDKARQKFWPGPLAWTDIDDLAEKPDGIPRAWHSGPSRSSLDHAVVERLLAGDTIPSTKAERVEATRRWVASGRSAKALNQLHGWHDGRYAQGKDAA